MLANAVEQIASEADIKVQAAACDDIGAVDVFLHFWGVFEMQVLRLRGCAASLRMTNISDGSLMTIVVVHYLVAVRSGC